MKAAINVMIHAHEDTARIIPQKHTDGSRYIELHIGTSAIIFLTETMAAKISAVINSALADFDAEDKFRASLKASLENCDANS